MDQEESKILARMWMEKIDPFEPTPEIWQAMGDFLQEIIAKHGTEYIHIDTLLAKSDEVPAASEVLVICFMLKKKPDEAQPIREYAIMPLDDNRKVFAFLPARDEDEIDGS